MSQQTGETVPENGASVSQGDDLDTRNEQGSSVGWVATVEALQQRKLDLESVESSVVELLDFGAKMELSDLFFACESNHVSVTARRGGSVVPIVKLPLDYGKRCISHIRILAGLKVDGHRTPQDGRWWFALDEEGATADLRLNTIPTLHGETMAIRLLNRDHRLTQTAQLGFTTNQLDGIDELLLSSGGLILVVGPTGGGKTTTLYAFLHQLNSGKMKIHTIEDPIEYAVPGLHQSTVDEVLGPGFAELLQAVLRQSPDVIMIGEIRNAQTAEIAVRAANSGSLVMATVHAPSVVRAIQSMLAFGVSPHFLGSSLLGVIGQRLMRKVNPENRVPIDHRPLQHLFSEVEPWLPDNIEVYAPASEIPEEDAYRGQTGIFEVLALTPKLRELVRNGEPPHLLAKQAEAEGMLDFRKVALLKVARGETTFDEMARVLNATTADHE